MTLIAAADGSALGNPGAAGWAWYIDEDRWKSGGWSHATNNQAELMAVLSLLQETADDETPLHILCDSQYVINALTQWLPGWKRRGWRKADGKAVLNRDLLEPLDEHLRGRSVTFEWVKGHSGHVLNEKVDELAKQAATAFQRGGKPNDGPGFSARSQTKVVEECAPAHTAPTLFELIDEDSKPASGLQHTQNEILLGELLLRSGHNTDANSRLLRPGSILVTHTGALLQAPWDEELLQGVDDEARGFEILQFTQLTPDTVLCVFRTESGSTCSSIWQRDGAGWHRVMHQESK